ncbi:hypothetical protein WG29040_23490 [Pseudomonas sp. PAMC 29040]|uniref:hypothetical protein n=1 Tax=Pseudomonas sp. PAMC 29040 TaxID=2498450 RepID=UPI000FB6BD39|nr:hypothetical protein [Pseudomonas sp. PAMC 29040]RUT30905.1 hypothetical protein WG29040_23490 [Pseudomonas sp. PAMC 29040]
MSKPIKRTLLQRLFRGGLGRPLINLWVEERTSADCQRTINTKLKFGRYTILHWERVHTNMDVFD